MDSEPRLEPDSGIDYAPETIVIDTPTFRLASCKVSAKEIKEIGSIPGGPLWSRLEHTSCERVFLNLWDKADGRTACILAEMVAGVCIDHVVSKYEVSILSPIGATVWRTCPADAIEEAVIFTALVEALRCYAVTGEFRCREGQGRIPKMRGPEDG